jgi:hypothetical protein
MEIEELGSRVDKVSVECNMLLLRKQFGMIASSYHAL